MQDEKTKTIQVRALTTGFVKVGFDPTTGRSLDHRVRGDDTKGDGFGDVFTLFPYEITLVDQVTSKPRYHAKDKAKCEKCSGEHVPGQVMRRLLTAEEQFSPRWMERLEEPTPESGYTSAQQALAIEEARLKGEPVGKRSRQPQTVGA